MITGLDHVAIAVRDSGIRWRAFLGLVVFALVREIRFLHAFQPDPEGKELAALRAELDAVARRFA